MKQKRYLQIYEQLRKKIIDNTYKYGDKLPSKRVTADDYNVSLVTVEHAYELLLEEDYIRAVERSGYFVSYKESSYYANPSTSKTEYLPPKMQTESPLSSKETFSYDIYAKTIRKVLSDYSEEIMQKSPFGGVPLLREGIGDYLKRSRDIHVDSTQIFIGSGAEYLYGLLCQFLDKDIPYAIESPSYQQIQKVYEANGITPRLLPLGKDGIISEDLWNTDAKVLHITPYRSYPTGVSASASKKREYLKWAKENSALILEDDFESEFTPSRKSAETLFSLDTSENVIYLNTFSKTFSSSVRIAYMVIPHRLLDEFINKVGFYACTVPTLEQYALAYIINNGDFERHINRMRRHLRK